MKTSARVITIFVAGLACITGTLLFTYAYGSKVIRLNQELLLHRETLDHLQYFLSTMKDAETGQRGYVITGDSAYLRPYREALVKVDQEKKSVMNAARGTSSEKTADHLMEVTQAKLDELKRVIELREKEGFDPAQKAVQQNRGRDLMDSVRADAETLLDVQRQAFRAALEATTTATETRTLVFIFVGVANLFFLAWAFTRLSNEMRKNVAAKLEMERQRNLLNVTLTSIGDCVMVTDMNGAITFMNTVAENLTGWKLAEARGLPVATVFNIINEYSREVVENPVDKVLRLGQIVGLANHTLLIRKDGSEVSIDDSGAPIREEDGTLRGVVLVFRDFTDYKTAQTALESAKHEAEQANQRKDQFLAMLSHELRTPLTPVLTTFNLWESAPEVPAMIKEDVRMLRHNIELEARLIDDLLDLTRIGRGLLPLKQEVADVHQLIGSVVSMYESDILGRELTLDVDLRAEHHHAHLDPARAQQVFWNLLRNAAKFTPAGGRITIATQNDGSNLVITFSDTGIGITQETLARMFQPFEQGESRPGRSYEGLGLGLAISKALVVGMDGTISAESEGPDKGARLIVVFPARAPATAATGPGASPAEPDETENRPLRIFMLEDHVHTSQALSRFLKTRGHTVETAPTVAQAVASIKQDGDYDLFLCDLGLSDGTGFDFLRQAREFNATPAIALSGFGMEEDIARCEQAGFAAHLTKPLDLQRLQILIRRFARPKKG